MRKPIALAALFVSLAVVPVASARPTLSIKRARPAIAHALNVTPQGCHRNGPLKVRCQITTHEEGWTVTAEAEATLRRTGHVEVTIPHFR
jgi:hypothetical protein